VARTSPRCPASFPSIPSNIRRPRAGNVLEGLGEGAEVAGENHRAGRVAQCEIPDIIEPETASDHARLNRPAARAAPGPWRALVVYRYTISGVCYETTQDVTEPLSGDRPPMPGQVASLKYDPANPSNSILVTGIWPGPNIRTPKAAAPGKGK